MSTSLVARIRTHLKESEAKPTPPLPESGITDKEGTELSKLESEISSVNSRISELKTQGGHFDEIKDLEKDLEDLEDKRRKLTLGESTREFVKSTGLTESAATSDQAKQYLNWLETKFLPLAQEHGVTKQNLDNASFCIQAVKDFVGKIPAAPTA